MIGHLTKDTSRMSDVRDNLTLEHTSTMPVDASNASFPLTKCGN